MRAATAALLRSIETDRPLALLLEGGAEIAQTDLSELIRAVSSPDFAGEMVLFKSAHKVKTAYLLVQDGLMETLTSKQQAAVEQAAVMACGYCRTLTDQQRESQLDELEELGASVQEINLEKYFALLGDIYQYESAGMNYRPDDELSRYVRSDGAQETF